MAPMKVALLDKHDEERVAECTGPPSAKIWAAYEALPSGILSLEIELTVRCEVDASKIITEGQASVQLSLIRPRSPGAKRSELADILSSVQHGTPGDFAAEFERLGFDLLALRDNQKSMDLAVAVVPGSEEWQEFSVTIRSSGHEEPSILTEAFDRAVEGDRLVLWAVSKIPSLRLHLKETGLVCCVKGNYNPALPEGPEEKSESSSDQNYPSYLHLNDSAMAERPSHSTPVLPFLPDQDERGPLYSDDPDRGERQKIQWNKSPTCDCGDCGRQRVVSCLNGMYPGDWITVRCPGPCEPHADQQITTNDTRLQGSDEAACDSAVCRAVANPCSHYATSRAGKDLIRLVLVLPATNDDELEAIVFDYDRRESRSLLYLALSYCWGDLNKTRKVTLSHLHQKPDNERGLPGLCYRHSYNITENLYAALIRIRDSFKPILCWVDALCIDQGRLDDRNTQVLGIPEVYRKAMHVVIWLSGPQDVIETTHFGLARMGLALLKEYGDAFNPYANSREYVRFYERVHKPKCKDCRKIQELPLEDYFSLPWFRRMWVLQEVFQCNANATVLPQSGRMISFKELAIGMEYQWTTTRVVKDRSSIAPFLWSILCSHLRAPGHRMEYNGTGVSVRGPETPSIELGREERLEALHLFQEGLQFDSTDPKDKIYAILGLARELVGLSEWPFLIRPDYSKSDAEVFSSFSKFCILQSKTLETLSVASRGARSYLLDSESPALPQPYQFPSKDHPSWALWHAQRRVWTFLRIQHHPNYNYLICHAMLFKERGEDTNSCRQPCVFTHVDTSLIETEAEWSRLRLRGIQLDEIETVFPINITHYGRAIIGSDAKEVPSGLKLLWKMLLGDYRKSTLLPLSDTSGTAPNDSQKEASLFDEFLCTLICDSHTSVRRINSQPPIYQAALYDNDRPTESSLMHNFVQFWLLLQPGHGPGSSDEDADLFKKPLPPLQGADLPEAVVKAWQALMPELAKWSENEKRQRIEQAENYLHHTPGYWYFRSKSGAIGMCPYRTKAGDILVALRGALHLSVLRPKEDNSGGAPAQDRDWMFVGEAKVSKWLHGGFMDDPELDPDREEKIWTLV